MAKGSAAEHAHRPQNAAMIERRQAFMPHHPMLTVWQVGGMWVAASGEVHNRCQRLQMSCRYGSVHARRVGKRRAKGCPSPDLLLQHQTGNRLRP